MAANLQEDVRRRGRRLRIAIWSGAVFLLLLPLIAMQFTDEVNWDETDFIVFGGMLAVACGTYELAFRMTGSRAYRAGVGVAVVAAFLLIWVNLAVGIIGSEDNPANLMYAGVLAVAVVGAITARGQSHGMARALFATACVQALVAFVALAGGMVPTYNTTQQILVLNGFFAAFWVLSAWLFWKAAREQMRAGAASK